MEYGTLGRILVAVKALSSTPHSECYTVSYRLMAPFAIKATLLHIDSPSACTYPCSVHIGSERRMSTGAAQSVKDISGSGNNRQLFNYPSADIIIILRDYAFLSWN